MRTSLNNIKENEDFLLSTMSPPEKLLVSAKMLLDPVLRAQIMLLKKTYSLIRIYGRKQMKSEIAAVEKKIFTDPSRKQFQKKIEQLFFK